MKSFRNILLDFARAINQHTHRFDGLKAKLHLTELASVALVRPIDAKSAASILAKLDTTSVLAKASADSCFHIIMVEKMGDILACEPIARFLKRRYPHCRVTWYVRDVYSELLRNNPAIDELIEIDCLSSAFDAYTKRAALDPKSILINCHAEGSCCEKTKRCFHNPANLLLTAQNYYAIGTLTETFFLTAGLPKTDMRPMLYLSKDARAHESLNIPYIVCHTASDDPNRNWNSTKWNELAEELRHRGCYLVEIGINKTIRNLDFDFTGRRSLADIGDIIAHAKLFIGIDSGFSHFANALEVPSVILLGKFRNFNQYNPYSGSFAKSNKFSIVRAPNCGKAKDVPVADVLSAISKVSHLSEA